MGFTGTVILPGAFTFSILSNFHQKVFLIIIMVRFYHIVILIVTRACGHNFDHNLDEVEMAKNQMRNIVIPFRED